MAVLSQALYIYISLTFSVLTACHYIIIGHMKINRVEKQVLIYYDNLHAY